MARYVHHTADTNDQASGDEKATPAATCRAATEAVVGIDYWNSLITI
jgi:hypothetical protein